MAIKRWVLCLKCGNRLGEEMPGGLVAQRHHGRRTIGVPLLISCEECQENWTPAPELLGVLRAMTETPQDAVILPIRDAA